MTTKYTISIQLPSCYNNGKSFTAKLEHVPCVHLDEISLYEMQAKTATMIVEPYCLQAAAVAHHVYDTIPKKYHDLAEVYPGCQICAGQRGNWVILNGFGGQLFNVQYIGEKGSFIFSNDSKIPNFVGLVDPDDCLQPGDRGLAFRHRGKWFVMRLTPKKQKQQFPECRAMVVGGNALPDPIKLLQQNLVPAQYPRLPTEAVDEYNLPRNVYPKFPTYIFPKIKSFYRPIVVDWNLFPAPVIDLSKTSDIVLPRPPDGIGYGILLNPCATEGGTWYEGIEHLIQSGGGDFDENNPRSAEYVRAAYYLDKNIPFAAIANRTSIEIHFLDALNAGVFYLLDPNIQYEQDKIDREKISQTAKKILKLNVYTKYFSITKNGKPIDVIAFGKNKTRKFITANDIQYNPYAGVVNIKLAAVDMVTGHSPAFNIEPYLPCTIMIKPLLYNMRTSLFSEEKELAVTKPGGNQSTPQNKYRLVYLWNTTESVLSLKDKVIIDPTPIKYYDQKGAFRYVHRVISVTSAYKFNTLEI